MTLKIMTPVLMETVINDIQLALSQVKPEDPLSPHPPLNISQYQQLRDNINAAIQVGPCSGPECAESEQLITITLSYGDIFSAVQYLLDMEFLHGKHSMRCLVGYYDRVLLRGRLMEAMDSQWDLKPKVILTSPPAKARAF
jgi:hypothetical protein